MKNNTKAIEIRNNMKAKGKAAYQDLIQLHATARHMLELLENARTQLNKVISNSEANCGSPDTPLSRVTKMKLPMKLPERLWFSWGCLPFYIDFRLSATEHTAEEPIVIGSIVYGTLTEKYGEEKNILEEKPLLAFMVNKNGLIEANREPKGQWWIGEPHEKEKGATKKQKEEIVNDAEDKQLAEFAEMHFRALKHIWKDALKWANENLLP